MLIFAEVNFMTQIKEKTGIRKSVVILIVIATVVTIRAVFKNGLHCTNFVPPRIQYIKIRFPCIVICAW